MLLRHSLQTALCEGGESIDVLGPEPPVAALGSDGQSGQSGCRSVGGGPYLAAIYARHSRRSIKVFKPGSGIVTVHRNEVMAHP